MEKWANLWLKEPHMPEEAEYNISPDIFLSLIAIILERYSYTSS
jgi:hypothetical protein